MEWWNSPPKKGVEVISLDLAQTLLQTLEILLDVGQILGELFLCICQNLLIVGQIGLQFLLNGFQLSHSGAKL